MNQRQLLHNFLSSERPLVMPDAYDALSARLIELAGFKAVQCSGFSMALAAIAGPEQDVDRQRNLAITRDIVQAVSVPVMADGEDGFGPPASVYETVCAFLEIGVAGINLEDQVLPPPKVKGVVDSLLMVEKIRMARKAARDKKASDLVVNGRTDALATCTDRASGIDEAIRRGNQYLEAGADLVFVTAVATADEARRLVKGIRGPVSIAAGMPHNLRTLAIAELRNCGVARVSLPTIAVFSALRAIRQTLSLVRQCDTFDELLNGQLLGSSEDVSQVLAR